jgi:hypothetical protein
VALRHPSRLHGLILGSSYLPGMASPLPGFLHSVVHAAVGWERGWWLLKTLRPGLFARIMGVPRGWDPSEDADFLAIREALFPIRPKTLGVAFDALISEPPPTSSRWRTSASQPCSFMQPTTASRRTNTSSRPSRAIPARV